jgi:hypothetical protein
LCLLCEYRLLSRTKILLRREKQLMGFFYGCVYFPVIEFHVIAQKCTPRTITIPKIYFYCIYFYLMTLYENTVHLSFNYHLKNLFFFWVTSGWRIFLLNFGVAPRLFYFNIKGCMSRSIKYIICWYY